MSDMICRKTMMSCQTPGMCSPHGGCKQPETLYATIDRDELKRLQADSEELAKLKKDADRYRVLRKVTAYRFKKIQDACITDGGDVFYFHADRFDAAIDAFMLAAQGDSHE